MSLPKSFTGRGVPQHAGMLPTTVRAVGLTAGDGLPAVPLLPLLPVPAGGGTGLCTPGREPQSEVLSPNRSPTRTTTHERARASVDCAQRHRASSHPSPEGRRRGAGARPAADRRPGAKHVRLVGRQLVRDRSQQQWETQSLPPR